LIQLASSEGFCVIWTWIRLWLWFGPHALQITGQLETTTLIFER